MAAKEIITPRKITLKVIGIKPDIEKLIKAPGKKMKLGLIMGVATRAKPGQSDLGPYVKFLGQFRATNADTGDVYESSTVILPKFLEEGLYAALPEGGGNVEFAFEISARYDADAATKYVYDAKNLLPVKESSQLLELTARVNETLKALPKPKD